MFISLQLCCCLLQFASINSFTQRIEFILHYNHKSKIIASVNANYALFMENQGNTDFILFFISNLRTSEEWHQTNQLHHIKPEHVENKKEIFRKLPIGFRTPAGKFTANGNRTRRELFPRSRAKAHRNPKQPMI